MTAETVGGLPTREAPIIPVMPPDLHRRDRKRWIDVSTRILTGYDVYIPWENMTYAHRLYLVLSDEIRSVIGVNTADGMVLPRFQFDEAGRLHSLVKASATRLRNPLDRADWWTKPNDVLGGDVPADALGDEDRSEELFAAIKELPSTQPSGFSPED